MAVFTLERQRTRSCPVHRLVTSSAIRIWYPWPRGLGRAVDPCCTLKAKERGSSVGKGCLLQRQEGLTCSPAEAGVGWPAHLQRQEGLTCWPAHLQRQEGLTCSSAEAGGGWPAHQQGMGRWQSSITFPHMDNFWCQPPVGRVSFPLPDNLARLN